MPPCGTSPETNADLVGGVVHLWIRVTVSHGQMSATLNGGIGLSRVGLTGIHGGVRTTTVLGDDSEVQPDATLRFPIGGTSAVNDDDYLVGCPELVCDVVDTADAHALTARRADDERYGATEVVMVTVREPRVLWLVGEGDRLTERSPDADGVYRSGVFPGLWLDPAALLAEDMQRLLDVLRQGLATPEHAAFAASLTPSPPAAG